MTLIGGEMVDYSAGIPSPQAIKDAGNIGVVRYVSPAREDWMGGKPLTKAEADALKAEGLLIASNWQYRKGGNDTSDWLRGAPGADEDYPIAQQIHEEAGGHPDGVIYVSIDASPTWDMYEHQVRPYLARWQEHIGKDRLGVYCNARVIDWCRNDGIGTYFWQHNWSEDESIDGDHPEAHIHQYAIDSGEIDGVGVDDNRILKEDFGQWGTEQDARPPVGEEKPPVEETGDMSELERLEAMRGPWHGDPTWLPDVLKLWGLRVDYIGDPDPFEYGHGDFNEVCGVIGHHTAGGGTGDWQTVKWGRSDLPGPLSQLCLEKDGSYKFLAVGVAWHAGSGWGSDWAEKFTTDANWTTIGIEGVSRGTEINGQYDWTPEQLQSYKVGVAAILWFLTKDSSWFCGHLEYNLSDGKIDPAGIDLHQFRAEVQVLIDQGPPGSTGGGGEGTTAIEQCYEENDWLGKKSPTQPDELPTPDGVGAYQHYQGGSIYWSPSTNAQAVPKGGIYEFWASVGWETSWLGYPVAPHFSVGKRPGAQQDFQEGVICSEEGDGKAWPVSGGILDVWLEAGGVEGRYGWPRSREYQVAPDVVGQTFEHEKIFWRMTQGPVSETDFDQPVLPGD